MAEFDPLARYELPFDASSRNAVILAAQIGAQVKDDVFVSYTTLLLALLLGKNGGSIPPWRVEARRGIKIELVIGAKPGLYREGIEELADAVDAGRLSWPEGRSVFSASADEMLRSAVEIALKVPQRSVTTADIVESYAADVPPAHVAQARQWGLSDDLRKKLQLVLSNDRPGARKQAAKRKPASSQSSRKQLALVPGFDRAAATVLVMAFALSRRRRNEKTALLTSEALLVAMTESAAFLATDVAGEVIALHGMLAPDTSGAVYAQKCDELFDLPNDIVEVAARETSNFPPLTPNMQRILDTAHTFAKRMSSTDLVAPRHLTAALISEPDGAERACVATEILQDCGVSNDRLREALVEVIEGDHRNDNLVAWREVLIGANDYAVPVVVADVIPKDPRREDSLDLRRYSDALAALIAASDQKPPLSIAVFGPWGSGKSFFMGMIRAAVADFAQHDPLLEPTTGAANPSFIRRVVQIEFNAWHYAEGNLWASLVHAILVALQKEFDPSKNATEAESFASVLAQLRLRQAAQLEAKAALKEAEQRLAERRAALAVANEAAVARRLVEEQTPSIGAVIKGIQDEALEKLRPPGGANTKEAWIKSVGDSVNKAASYLGRPDLAKQVSDLQRAGKDAAAAEAALKVRVGEIGELLDEAKASAGRGLSLLTWLANARITPTDWTTLVLVVAFLLLLTLGAAVLFAGFGIRIAATISAVAAGVTPLLGSLAVAIGWARRHLANANRAFAILGSVRSRVEARSTEELAKRETDLVTARRATTEAEAEAARRLAECEAARVAFEKAEADVSAASSPEKLKQFVAQRLADGDYQRSLGLIHTIRSDLEHLAKILGSAAKASSLGTGTPVQRIVLYIDDLDRCAPARVVEVLEAVHLLLAFPLFVVVVGVDIRWVAQALRERYPSQLGETPGIASPTDYLEKVFQIPFWLPPMNAAAGRRLLAAAIGGAPVESSAESPAENIEPPEPDETSLDTTSEQRVEHDGGNQTPAPDPAVQARRAATRAATALQIGDLERDRLLDMAGAIGASPRRAKRFANLYRVLKASLSPAERRGFVLDGGKGGTYPGALALLAAATGAPDATRALLAALAQAPSSDPASYLQSRFDIAFDKAAPDEKAAFEALRQVANETDDKESFVGNLRFWAPGVARFLFVAEEFGGQNLPPSSPTAPDLGINASRRPQNSASSNASPIS